MLNLTVSAADYPEADFPDFYPAYISEVLAQLNTTLQHSIDGPIPEGATRDEVVKTLRDDILKHPELYLTAELLNKISKRA